MRQAVVTGCSHTAGCGLSGPNYVDYLNDHYCYDVKNYGLGSAGATHVLQTITEQVKSKPIFIVAQWPNPFRRTMWINEKPLLENINSCGECFKLLLKSGDANFYEPWLQCIIIGNLLCQGFDVPIINIMLESLDEKYLDRLNANNIKLHIDEKNRD